MAEQRISDTEDHVFVMQNTVDTLQQQVKLLGVKLEDQEYQSHRNNVCFTEESKGLRCGGFSREMAARGTGTGVS